MVSRTLAGKLALKGDWTLGEDNWKDENDLNLLKLSVFAQGSVKSIVAATPGAPTEGDIHIFDDTHPTQPNKVAVYDEGAWTYFSPWDGLLLWNEDDDKHYSYTTAGGWEELATGTGGGGGGGGGGLYDISMGIPNPLTTLGDGAKFTWTQNGTKGANVKKGAAACGPSCAGWIVPKTTGAAWEVAVLLIMNNYATQYYGTQIGLHNSVNGRLITLADFQGLYNQSEFHRYTNYSTRNDIPVTYGNGAHAQGPKWMHIKDDGAGNIKLGLSNDGANPVWMRTTTTADWVGAYTHVFFGGFFETTINVDGASVSVLCYDDEGQDRVVGV